MVTIKDVARIAGVSTATVSRVIHNGTQVGEACRARVKKVIAELGYQPNANAQALVSRTTNTVGVVTPKLSMAFFGTLASGVEHAVRQHGYKLLMANSLYETQSELDAIQSLRQHNCQAIILHSEYSDEATLIRLAQEIPGLVLVNRYIPQIANRCVWLDNVRGGQLVTEYLLQKGHQQFAAVTSIYQNRDPADRLKGSRQALAEQGLTLAPQAVAEGPANMEGGEQAVRELLARGVPFTALLAYNDLMAIGAIHGLFAAGLRVPEDVAVVGFDDLPVARACRPRLSTMHYPIEEMAAYAVELAIRLCQPGGKPVNQTHLFIPELVQRDSASSPQHVLL